MFLFFSSRLGCLGSLLVSAAVTVLLLLVIRLGFGYLILLCGFQLGDA